ncbi:MAG: PadR family transcriptional regulator [Dehalococcoidia bacterium]|nr:PadR family transcriptional regulator [Dehalococcoidia bacterium]
MFRRRIFRGEGFFGGPWRESPFHKGDLKYVVLGLIKDKPRYGYEIIRALEELSHGFYTPSPGVVYPTLQMLEEMGYISAVEQDGKKVYTITGDGLQFLDERKDLADEVKKHMRHHWGAENIDMLGQMMGEFGEMGRKMGHRLRHADPEKMQRVRDVISHAYREIEAILEE